MNFLAHKRHSAFSVVAPTFTPADLFSTEDGDWWDPSDLSKMWQNTGKTTAVTADGDPVAVIEGQEGNLDLIQGTSTKRPTYKTSAGKHWLLFDGTDDFLQQGTSLVNGATQTYANAYGTIAEDFIFIMKESSTTAWIGIGQSGSSNTSLDESASTQNGIYFDNVLSTETTRGGQYTLGAAASSALIDFTVDTIEWVNWGVGIYNSGGTADGPLTEYSILMIDRSLTSQERSDLDTYYAGLL